MSHLVVVGFGVTGRAVAGAAGGRGQPVVVIDDALPPGAPPEAAAPGVEVRATPVGADLDDLLAGATMVVPSPGVPAGHPVLVAASAVGVPVRSEIELAWARLAMRPEPRPLLVAVTGTNGKTTVTTLVAAVLAASGLRAVTGGNIGRPLIDAVNADADVVVAEVSSFQLQHTERWRPRVSCWLNLAEDHLDWHPDAAHYAAAKGRIWANQAEGDTVVVNADDPGVAAAAAGVPAGVRLWRYGTGAGCDLVDASPSGAADAPALARLLGPDGHDLLLGRHLRRALPHDRSNALAAAAAALAAGAGATGVAEGLAAAAPLPHRVELVAEADGIRWYDDSKATTPASVLAATSGMRSVVLIAGGRNKGLDLGALRRSAPPVHAVVAIGDAAEEVAAAFDGAAVVRRAPDMAAAVAAAGGLARPGDAVLLSPGCASFDWYRSYAARGDDFSRLVLSRLGRSRADADAAPTPPVEAHQ